MDPHDGRPAERDLRRPRTWGHGRLIAAGTVTPFDERDPPSHGIVSLRTRAGRLVRTDAVVLAAKTTVTDLARMHGSSFLIGRTTDDLKTRGRTYVARVVRGRIRWAHVFLASGANAISIDATRAGVFVTGYKYGRPGFLAFTVRISLSGRVRWVRTYRGGALTFGGAFGSAVAARGRRVYVAGRVRNQAGDGAFLRVYSLAGREIRTTRFGNEETLVDTLAVGTGAIYLTGLTDGGIPEWGSEVADESAYVAALALPDASPVWARDLTPATGTRTSHLRLVAERLYLMGSTRYRLPGDEREGGGTDLWVATLSAETGATGWAEQFGSDRADSPGAMTVRGATVIVCGTTVGRFQGRPDARGTDGFLVAIRPRSTVSG